MRFVLSAILACLLAVTATARTYTVPDTDLEITAIQQAVTLADPGDTVFVKNGIYDSVHVFDTPLGLRRAVVGITKDIVLKGNDRTRVIIDQSNAEYGILCMNVGREALIQNLTITGGAGRDRGAIDDGDGRYLTGGIACLEGGSPTISLVDIPVAATGIIVRSSTEDSAPMIDRVLIARCSHNGIYIYDNGGTPVEINRVTVVSNFDVGIKVNSGTAVITSSSITHNGKYGIDVYLSSLDISYCNVYWNDHMFPDPELGALNYSPTMSDPTGLDGNISEEPYYCDYVGTSGYNYSVCLSDPVSPNYHAGLGGVTIGARSAVCTGCISPVEPASWGAIKSLYR
jgi:hypothetical protein